MHKIWSVYIYHLNCYQKSNCHLISSKHIHLVSVCFDRLYNLDDEINVMLSTNYFGSWIWLLIFVEFCDFFFYLSLHEMYLLTLISMFEWIDSHVFISFYTPLTTTLIQDSFQSFRLASEVWISHFHWIRYRDFYALWISSTV